MKLSQWLKDRKKALRPAQINLRNALAVLQAGWRGSKIGGFVLPTHVQEQIIWRRTQVMEKSPECWKSGHCVVCGCEILGKTMEDRACSKIEDSELGEPCYPEMMKKYDWEDYKELNEIKLFE